MKNSLPKKILKFIAVIILLYTVISLYEGTPYWFKAIPKWGTDSILGFCFAVALILVVAIISLISVE
jgi:hypothetical protein